MIRDLLKYGMKKLLLLLMCAGMTYGQVNLATGRIAGSDYSSSELRGKVESGGNSRAITNVRGSKYFYNMHITGEVADGDVVVMKAGFDYNMESDEMELSNGKVFLPMEDSSIAFNEDKWYYNSDLGWCVEVFSEMEGRFFMHPTVEFEAAIPAANPKVRDVPAKWHRKNTFYTLEGDGVRKLSRKEAKPFKKKLKSNQVVDKMPKKKYEHKPHIFKQRGIGNVNHNDPNHTCDETCH